MPEFYSRETHEKVLDDLSANDELLSDSEQLTREDKLYLANEKRLLTREHERLFERAWIEASSENDRVDAERAAEAHAQFAEVAFGEAKNEFSEFLKNSPDRLAHYSIKELEFISQLPKIAEIILSEEVAADEHSTIHCRVKFPFPNPQYPHGYEERQAELLVSESGEILNWENAPLALRANKQGKALVLREILRCFQEIGMSVIPVLELDDSLVKQGEGDLTPQRGLGQEAAKPSFEATERFHILKSHQPLFICRESDVSRSAASGDTYTAFVYHDVIVFDSLFYGNAIYFLPLEEAISSEAFVGFTAKTKSEQQQTLRALLTEDFFTEIELSKSERRARNNRFPMAHPVRPEDESDADYRSHLEGYYDSLFRYINSQSRSRVIKNVEESTPRHTLEQQSS